MALTVPATWHYATYPEPDEWTSETLLYAASAADTADCMLYADQVQSLFDATAVAEVV